MNRYLLLAICLTPNLAFADLHECNGMWTNKPCDEGANTAAPSKTLKEQPLDPRAANPDFRRKQQVLRKLREDITYLNDAGVTHVNTSIVEDVCDQPNSSYSDCNAAYDLFRKSEAESFEKAKKELEHRELVNKVKSATEAAEKAKSAADDATKSADEATKAAEAAAIEANAARQESALLRHRLRKAQDKSVPVAQPGTQVDTTTVVIGK
ncbi:hypothetical protein JNK13_09805 [bacterium]|nr:hypothetical protein [bacterium]